MSSMAFPCSNARTSIAVTSHAYLKPDGLAAFEALIVENGGLPEGTVLVDSSYLIREFATDAIEQGWSIHRLLGKPSGSDDGGLIYFLKGERISEFSSGGVMTASGRVFQRHPPHAHAA